MKRGGTSSQRSKVRSVEACSELKKQQEIDHDVFSKVITGDEKCSCGCDQEQKAADNASGNPSSGQIKPKEEDPLLFFLTPRV